jgi:NAD(P)H-hydrate epimerase
MFFQMRIADTELLEAKFFAPAFDPLCQLGQLSGRKFMYGRTRTRLIWLLTRFVVHRYNSYMTEEFERLYTAEQVRRLDKCAIEDHGIPGIDLMELAGSSVFEQAVLKFPKSRCWLVFCGGGNNGGDGYIVARLAHEAGMDVVVCALKPIDSLSGDAATAASRWREAGGETRAWPVPDIELYDLLVDALLGTGLDRAPAGHYGDAIELINQSAAGVVAVDIPSGLNADTGQAMGKAAEADLTVTFIGRKRGLYTADGPDFAGSIEFSDLETPASVRDSIPDSGILIRENKIEKNLPPRRRNSHKGSFGWVLGVGSNMGMSGALRLCGEAALRSGAGKVTLATHPAHADLLNLACPELMVRGVERPEQLQNLLQQVDVLVTGTGLGQDTWSEELFRVCMKTRVRIVLDADGLNILAGLFGQMAIGDLPLGNWILTPHPAEAGRLLEIPASEVQRDRVTHAQQIAQRYNAVVVLKGCGTVIADPDGRYAICPLGNPGMASAGSGDVLAGVIAALLAQGLSLWEAAATGVAAHAWAGDIAAGLLGERGMLASDITQQLPAVLNPA